MTYTSFVVIFILAVLPCTFRLVQGVSVKLEKDILHNNTFPKDFLFGVSTYAPQYEGAWNVSDKGESVWDHMIHANPGLIEDGSNMDVACDFYHKYKEDLRLARSIGSQMFKLSFSWPRLLPSGFTNHVSKDGVRFYNDVLDEIAANGMIPMVVLLQMDLPYNLQKMGGLANPLFVDWFEQYARFVFTTFGDKVKHWITINDPNLLCVGGSGDYFIPLLQLSGIADYICGHHFLLAQARVYHMYDREFRPSQKGKIGYSIYFQYAQPADPSSPDDISIAEKDYQWFLGWLLHPVFSSTGDYTAIMKETIANRSRIQGFSMSRMPSLTQEQIRDVRGASDFLGINFYSHELATSMDNVDIDSVGFDFDSGSLAAEAFNFKDEPAMFGKLIRRLHEDYGAMFYITENGFSEAALEDKAKVAYLRGHIAEVLKAVQNGVNIQGYLLWSLLDNFEMSFGLQPKYGIFHVDFKNPNLTRTPRLSSKLITNIYTTRRLD